MRGGWWKIAVCVAALAAAVPQAEARKEFKPRGGAGDIHNGVDCPRGQYIVGYRGRAGAWIDHIKIRCAPLEAGGQVGESKTLNTRFGGMGGGELAVKCTNAIVNAIEINLTEGDRQVEFIYSNCFSPASGRVEHAMNFGNFYGPKKGRLIKNYCPDGEAAVGVRTHWGNHLNAIALICDTIRR